MTPVFIATGSGPRETAAVSTFPFLPNREEAVLIAGAVVGKGRTRGVGGWKNGPASPGLALAGELALEVEALS